MVTIQKKFQSFLDEKVGASKAMSPQNKYDEKGIRIQQDMQRQCMRGDSHAGDGPGPYSVSRPFGLLGYLYFTFGMPSYDII